MRKGRWSVGSLVVLVAATAFYPDLRLQRELAAARSEGLWTTATQVRQAVQAGLAEPTPIRIGPDAREVEQGLVANTRSLEKFIGGGATVAERREARTTLMKLEPTLSMWRAISRQPVLVRDRNYEDGFGTLYSEFGWVKQTTDWLIAAAELGLKPEENLKAAARLSALVRREPGIIPATFGSEIGRKTLRSAKGLSLSRPVEAAMGPAPDVRRILGPELPAFLVSMDYRAYTRGLVDLGIKTELSWSERLTHYGPFARNTKAAGVAGWRTLWSRLPQDGGDYDGAAKVVDEEWPKMDLLMPSYAEVIARLIARTGDPGRGGFLRAIGEFERERAKVRAAR